MSALVFDIETVPTAASLAAPYPAEERLPPKNYVKDEAIAGWRVRDEAEWSAARVKECSLNPRLGRVVCAGFQLGKAAPIHIQASTEADERHILAEFWSLAAAKQGRVATFNGHSFDLPFLLVRSLIVGVEPTVPVGPWLRRYTFAPHFDCRMALSNWDLRGDGTLGDWCRAFGIACDTGGLGGADIHRLYVAGDLDQIAAKCRADVAATALLYGKLAPVYA